ncbi:MAG: GNAT family N-acetyltransferase, partial [Planctomycetota bacterium]
MITYTTITAHHPLYPGECQLRELVLLRPIGYDMDRFRAEYPGVEDKFLHFVAVMGSPGGDRVVGCVLLLLETDTPGVGKLMQMAVHPQRQGEGIGKRLVVEVEKHAFAELGLAGLYCHAQLQAVSFYENLGWTVVGEVFEEAGIPHRKMTITNQAPSAEPVPVPDW